MTEYREEGGSIGGSLLTFLLGVAVGATVAILYAPAAGAETRQQIADKAGQLKDKAGELKTQVAEKAGEWKDRATEMMNRAEERTAGMMDSAQDALRRTGDTAKAGVRDVSEAARG